MRRSGVQLLELLVNVWHAELGCPDACSTRSLHQSRLRRYLWLPMWALELSEEEQALAGQRVQGKGQLAMPAATAQLPARLPVAGVDCVVRWLASWTLHDLSTTPVSRFAMA